MASRVCKSCGKEKNLADFYVNNKTNCKECWKAKSLKQHQAKFKYVSDIYQCILFKMGLCTRKDIDKHFEDNVVNTIINDESFEIKFLESIRKRMIQRCVRDVVKPEITPLFNEIAEKITLEKTNKVIEEGENHDS